MQMCFFFSDMKKKKLFSQIIKPVYFNANVCIVFEHKNKYNRIYGFLLHYYIISRHESMSVGHNKKNKYKRDVHFSSNTSNLSTFNFLLDTN